MSVSLAKAITKAASRQTYYTIGLLVDRGHVEDAYRAYAYFRWVDDVLDAEWADGDAVHQRKAFLERQKRLLDACLRGLPPGDLDPHERMLAELVPRNRTGEFGLTSYLRNMMLVMDFDVRRRGHLVSGAELDQYTRWLAIAVSGAMSHFIGNGAPAPDDDTRYMAVAGAHILHMLRDTSQDVAAGYFNIPREVLEAGAIEPSEVRSAAYRSWVAQRVSLARVCLDAGVAYFANVQSVRHRLAGLAYVARFEWMIDALESDGFTVRPRYEPPRGPRAALRMAMTLARRLVMPRTTPPPSVPVRARRRSRT
ncbi:MAG TPA: squalene/phytoene synthase family protein [Candidatus Limnocylindrales bacterium]|nr:squalene/phytoene synthase family protein [Candidatus Limnocylindrales bacterium]